MNALSRRRNAASEPKPQDHDFNKVLRFCAFRPRNRFEVEKKMVQMGLCESIRKKYMAKLLKEKIIQDEEYLRAYIRGKVFKNRWGRLKIAHQLRQEGFSPRTVAKAFRENVEEEEYEQVARLVLNMRKKYLMSKGFDAEDLRIRCFNYMIAKGYEPSLVERLCCELRREASS
ncbi:MAG: RecX family transcriptional regulator [Flavobacteriales bacterium]|nr:RecX family transcriptional regulator [Flavobacteriales bacterium]MCX7768636.1 RecX family transcriptional regulator [Flavobacteriales bacterium]MDW8410374.1 RecX family transcriptional regulator [Flavobacteriales bacterium]